MTDQSPTTGPAASPDTKGPADLKQGGGDPAATLSSTEGLDPGGAGDLTGTDGDTPRNSRDVDDRPLGGDGREGSTLGEAAGSGAGSADPGAGTPPDTAGLGGGAGGTSRP